MILGHEAADIKNSKFLKKKVTMLQNVLILKPKVEIYERKKFNNKSCDLVKFEIR